MIAEFVEMQNNINARAKQVGRTIIDWRHFTVEQIAAPFISPPIDSAGSDYVNVALGISHRGQRINVRVPLDLFENGTEGDIRTWVTRQNNTRQAEFEAEAVNDRDAKRSREIAILKELQAKYPDICKE